MGPPERREKKRRTAETKGQKSARKRRGSSVTTDQVPQEKAAPLADSDTDPQQPRAVVSAPGLSPPLKRAKSRSRKELVFLYERFKELEMQPVETDDGVLTGNHKLTQKWSEKLELRYTAFVHI